MDQKDDLTPEEKKTVSIVISPISSDTIYDFDNQYFSRIGIPRTCTDEDDLRPISDILGDEAEAENFMIIEFDD